MKQAVGSQTAFGSKNLHYQILNTSKVSTTARLIELLMFNGTSTQNSKFVARSCMRRDHAHSKQLADMTILRTGTIKQTDGLFNSIRLIQTAY